MPEVSSERRSLEDVNFNHSHRRQLRCCNGNFSEQIRQQKIDTASPQRWKCLLSISFKWKHLGITLICRYNGGAQTFSSEHGTTSWASGPLFCELDCKKLPTETRKFWELSSKSKELQAYQELKTFLEERAQALESASLSNSSSNTEKQSHSQQNRAQRELHTHVTKTNQQFKYCEDKHRIFNCGKFKGLGVKERAELIKVKGLCFNCLRPVHRSDSFEGSSCRQCGRKHHTLLHQEYAH